MTIQPNTINSTARPFSAPYSARKASSKVSSLPTSTPSSTQSPSEYNFSVFVRVRPLTAEELGASGSATITVMDNNFLVFDPAQARASKYRKGLHDHSKRSKEHKYAFDRVFSEMATQRQVFENSTLSLIDGVFDGLNATVFAYGATGAGKTHTMAGTPSDPGIMVLTMCELFDRIEKCRNEKIIDLRVTYLEIYNETIRDLLADGPCQPLDLREDAQQGISITGLSEHIPESVQHVMALLKKGNANRMMSPTQANATSSRSHAVLQIHIQQKDRTANVVSDVQCAKLSLIDLAGSERACVTQNRGERIREGANINRSLLALGNCINALCASKKPQHIPYRDSKLTRLLKYSLGGNCRTVMIAAVSPFIQHYEDTYNTLVYANRAKNIKTTVEKNTVQVNYHIRQYVQIISELRLEIEELKSKMASSEASSTTPEPQLSLMEDHTPTLHRLKSEKSLEELIREIEILTKESQLYEGSSVDLTGLVMVHEVCLEAIRFLLSSGQEIFTASEQATYPMILQLENHLSTMHENIAFLQDELASTFVTVDELRDRLTQYRQNRHSLLPEHMKQIDQLVSQSTLKISQHQMEKHTKELVRINDIQRQWSAQVCSYCIEMVKMQDKIGASDRIKLWHQLSSSFLESQYLSACQSSCSMMLSESESASAMAAKSGRWSVSFGEPRIKKILDNSFSAGSGSRYSLAPEVEKSLRVSRSETPPIASTPPLKRILSPATVIKTKDALESWKKVCMTNSSGSTCASPTLLKDGKKTSSASHDSLQVGNLIFGSKRSYQSYDDLPVRSQKTTGPIKDDAVAEESYLVAEEDENSRTGIFSVVSVDEEEEFGEFISAPHGELMPSEVLIVEDLDAVADDEMVNPKKTLLKSKRSFSTSRIPRKPINDLTRLDDDDDDGGKSFDPVDDEIHLSRTLSESGRSQSEITGRKKSMASRIAGWFSPRRSTNTPTAMDEEKETPMPSPPKKVTMMLKKKVVADEDRKENSRPRRQSMIPSASASLPKVTTESKAPVNNSSRKRRDSSLPRMTPPVISETRTSRLRRQTVSNSTNMMNTSQVDPVSFTTPKKKKKSWAAKVIHSFSPFNKKSQEKIPTTLNNVSDRTRSKEQQRQQNDPVGLGQLLSQN